MKKLIASLALIGLASLAFGQDAPKPAPALVLSGKLNSGVTVLANGADSAQTAVWGDDAGTLGGRLTLIGKYTDGDFGLSFETRWDGLLTNANTKVAALGDTVYSPVYFKHAYLQGQFFDKMVLTQVGIVKEESTRSVGDKGFKFATEVPGAVVVVKPIKDLAFQAFVGAASAQTAVSTLGIGSFVDTISALSIAYTVADLTKVTAGVKFNNSKYNGYVPSDAYAGASFVAVPNLTASVEYGVEKLNSGKLEGKTTIAETIQYGFKDLGMAPLTVGLKAYQYLYDADIKTKSNSTGASTEAQGMSLRVQPWVTYALDGGLTPKLEVAYVSGASVVAGDYDKYLGSTVKANADNKKANANNQALFEVRPSVKFAFTKTQSLNAIYSYTKSIGSDDVTFVTGHKDATSLHNFQLDYVFSF